MIPALQNFERYIRRAASGDPKDFYSLFVKWQVKTRPRPFRVLDKSFSFCQTELEVDIEVPAIGFFEWDYAEQVPRMVLESDTQLQYLRFYVDEYKILSIESSEPVERVAQSEEISYGERLEVVYDVLDACQAKEPQKDLTKLSLKEFKETLKELRAEADSKARAAMSKIKKAGLDVVLNHALQDWATDELTPQLTLPISGSFAADKLTEKTEDDAVRKSGVEVPLSLQTQWQQARQVLLLQTACQYTIAAQETYVLELAKAEILSEDDGVLQLRVPVENALPIRSSESIPVFKRGERDRLGSFTINLWDEDVVFGELVWEDPGLADELRDRVYARPRRGPNKFVSGELEKMFQLLNDGETESLSPAIQAVLGGSTETIKEQSLALAPYELNVQQQQAWADSVDENRPVALVQGPPGTGKTQVITAIIRTLVEKGKRVLVAAPSNTATDNICRRILDLPVLRFGKHEDSVHPDVVSSCWVGDIENVKRYAAKRNEFAGTGAYTGTPVGLLRSDIVQSDFEKNGPFDCLIFDEASMSRTDVFLLCANLAKRLVLFGDHQQLPPFPLPDCVLKDLNDGLGPFTSSEETLLKGSALEWLHNARNCPLLTLSCTYRCQNPRLLRFASTLFYNALVHVSPDAEFFQLDYKQRKEAFPASTLQLMITSQLPAEERNEQVHVAPGEMGFYNECEAKHCVEQFISYLGRYAFEQIQILTPYRCQMKRIRELLREADLPGKPTDEDEAGLEAYNNEIDARVRTVDGFQGAEADAVIISYVRSNPQGSVGFVADHNRINVAHTRCRRELTVVADIQFLKDNADTDIFARMERAFQRDGIVIDVNK